MESPSAASAPRHTINRGVQEAPVAAPGPRPHAGASPPIGATGRVVVPILIQQAIDQGISGEARCESASSRCSRRSPPSRSSSPPLAQRTAVARLGRRSEQALFGLRVRLIAHIHRLSLADHNEERRGALVARVTSDIETLAQFFSWGGLAWLLDGTLMVIVAAVMLAYDWVLALVAFVVAAAAGARAARRAAPPRRGLRPGARAQRRDARRRSPRSSPARRRCGPTAPATCARSRPETSSSSGQERRSGPRSSARSCSRPARCSPCSRSPP